MHVFRRGKVAPWGPHGKTPEKQMVLAAVLDLLDHHWLGVPTLGPDHSEVTAAGRHFLSAAADFIDQGLCGLEKWTQLF